MLNVIREPSRVLFISTSRHTSQPLQPYWLLSKWALTTYMRLSCLSLFVTNGLWVMKSKAFGRRDLSGRLMDLAGSLGLGGAQKKEGSKGYRSL